MAIAEQSITTTANAPAVRPSSSTKAATRAEILLGVAFVFFLLGVGVGVGWDRRWHATHPFEDFFSPPHWFIYTNVLLSAATVVYLTFNARTRAAFGATQPLLLFPFKVPRALMLLGAGLVVIALGGLFDGIWHTLFGLDETNWSLPHAMLGHGILLAALGFAAARLALPRKLQWWAAGILAWIILGVAVDLIGGPILRNPPPDALRAIAQLPVLAADAAYQHTSRIYLTWNLDRTNWLFLPMISITVGLGLGLAKRLTGLRDRWLVAVSAFGVALALLDREGGPSIWARVLLAPPFLPAALGYAGAHRLGANKLVAWSVAGWLACAVSSIWVHNVLLVLVCGPLALAGVWVAERLIEVIDTPSRRSVIATAAIIGVLLPALTGCIDLYLRMHTP
jgi:hypothetical protein